VLHRQGLRENWQLVERSSREAAVEILIEGRARVGPFAKARQLFPLVCLDIVAGPSFVKPQTAKLSQHRDEQAQIHRTGRPSSGGSSRCTSLWRPRP
jgi:hypothetical protein